MAKPERKSKTRVKKRKLSACKKAAWDALSKCVRYSHAIDGVNAACVTCGAVHRWQDLDAGHFIPKNKSNAVFFHSSNVHPQCTYCNRFLHGNIQNYYPYMLENYGQTIIDWIKDHQTMHMNWRQADYEEMEIHYKSMFAWMQEQRREGVTGMLELVPWA